VIPRAFRIAASGRPGPVLVDIPKDVQGQAIAIASWPEPGRALAAPPPAAELLAHAAQLIDVAERPILYLGGGVVHSGAAGQALALAEKASLPTVMTLMALGALATDHPLSLGMLGMHGARCTNLALEACDLLLAVDPALFGEILGSTDSELMFYLALTFGLEKDPLGGLARMAGFVERTARAHGVEQPLWMTLGVSDGESIWAVRYASDGDAPTLYCTRDVKDLAAVNPDIERILGRQARAVVSEPIGKFAEIWTEVPQSSALHARAGKLEILPFKPNG